MMFNVGDVVRYKPSLYPGWANQPLTITAREFEDRYIGSGTYPTDNLPFTDTYLGSADVLELFYPETASDFEVDI